MFGTNAVGSTFSLTRVLGGISKGLSIANQVIPLYQQAKPMIQNAKKVMSVLKEFNKSSTPTTSNNKTTIDIDETPKKTDVINQSRPVFFQ